MGVSPAARALWEPWPLPMCTHRRRQQSLSLELRPLAQQEEAASFFYRRFSEPLKQQPDKYRRMTCYL